MVREKIKSDKSIVGKSLLSYFNPYCEISEQYRMIRNNILYASKGSEVKTLLIASPAKGDGRTTATINLAICMAQRGERVLIIDANLRNPVLHKAFNIKASPGLSNVLSQQLSPSDTIYRTDIEGMHILPSGQRLLNSTDLFDSAAMRDLIKYASTHYDRVLIDTPPVLGLSDTLSLASLCDGVIMLLKNGKSNQEQALKVQSALLFASANVLGVILNNKSG